MSAVLGVLAATALVVLLTTWAASSGPDDVFRGDGSTVSASARPSSEAATPLTPPPARPGHGHSHHPHVPGWVRPALLVLVAGFAAVVAYALFGALRSALAQKSARPRPARDREPPEIDFEVVDPVNAVVAAMTEDADEQEALLGAGSPRNGIVECWNRFEVQAERAGLPRRPAETSSEFTLRLLDLVEADASAVVRLGGLYREARFSEHGLDEQDRDAARGALLDIHEQLRGLISPGTS